MIGIFVSRTSWHG